MKENRIKFIDIAKGIGILFVVIGHCIEGNSLLGKWIWSFHMPLFFILSGMCFSEKKYPVFLQFLKKRIKTLLLPCAYFSFIISLVASMTNSSVFALKKLIYVGLPGALWFVLILFISEIFYYFIQKFCKVKIVIAIALILSLIIGIVLNREGIKLSHSFCTAFIATFYYGLGHISKSIIKKFTEYKYKLFSSLLMLTIPFITAMLTSTRIELSDNMIPPPEFYFIMVSIVGSIGIITISAINLSCTWAVRIILFLGKNTLIILALHIMFIDLSCKYIQPLISERLVYKVVEQAFIWIMLFLSIEFINSRAKWLIGKY